MFSVHLKFLSLPSGANAHWFLNTAAHWQGIQQMSKPCFFLLYNKCCHRQDVVTDWTGHRLDMDTDLTLIFKILNKKNVEGQKDGFFFGGGGGPFCFCFFWGERGIFLEGQNIFFGGGEKKFPPQKKNVEPPPKKKNSPLQKKICPPQKFFFTPPPKKNVFFLTL